ncbi:MAG: DUF177 domain-containing protein [Bacteroidota bacterium]
MLQFKIFEIPEQQSERTVTLSSGALELGSIPFAGGEVALQFYRNVHFIRVVFTAKAEVELVCDRSLDVFPYTLNASYEVVFKDDVKEESIDESGAIRKLDFSQKYIDLEADVRDSLLLSVPNKKLHPRFLDEHGEPKEEFYQQFGEVESGDSAETLDPRWEALKELKK